MQTPQLSAQAPSVNPAAARAEDEALIARLVAASPLEDNDAKIGLATDFAVASRAIAAIRKKLDDETTVSDEVRALPALISNRRRLLEALKLVKEKRPSLGLSLDDEEDGDETTPPPKPLQTSAPDDADDEDLLTEIRS